VNLSFFFHKIIIKSKKLEKDKNTLLMKFEEQKKHWEAAKAQESKELNKKLESLATELQYKVI